MTLCLVFPINSSSFFTASTIRAFLPQVKKEYPQQTNVQTPPLLSYPSGCSAGVLLLPGGKRRAKRQAGKPYPNPSLISKATSKCSSLKQLLWRCLVKNKKTTNAKRNSRRDIDILQRHEQSLPTPLSAVSLPRKSWSAESPAWLHDAGELPGDRVLPPICLFGGAGGQNALSSKAPNCLLTGPARCRGDAG